MRIQNNGINTNTTIRDLETKKEESSDILELEKAEDNINSETVRVDISEEGMKKSADLNANAKGGYRYVKLSNYNPSQYDKNYFQYLDAAMADIDPVAYSKFRTMEAEENGKDNNKYATQFFEGWIKNNKDKIKAWQEKGLAGSEFERKYDAELYISDGDRGDTMFSHIRTMPTRTVMELSAEQYMRIQDQGDKGLTKLLEDSLKSADEIAKRLDEKGEERLYQARIGFTLNDDGTATYYVHAKDDNTPADEHTTAHIYASKDIDELVQNVINKENGMSHFQYID